MKLKHKLEKYLGKSIVQINYDRGTWQENNISSDFSKLNPTNFALNVKNLQLNFESGSPLVIANKRGHILKTASLIETEQIANGLTVPDSLHWNSIQNSPISKIDLWTSDFLIPKLAKELTLIAFYFENGKALILSSRIIEVGSTHLTMLGQINDNLQICLNRRVDVNRYDEDVNVTYRMLNKMRRIKRPHNNS